MGLRRGRGGQFGNASDVQIRIVPSIEEENPALEADDLGDDNLEQLGVVEVGTWSFQLVKAQLGPLLVLLKLSAPHQLFVYPH